MTFGTSTKLNEGDIAIMIRKDGTVEIVSGIIADALAEHGEQIQDNMLAALGFVHMVGNFETHRMLTSAGMSDEAQSLLHNYDTGETPH